MDEAARLRVVVQAMGLRETQRGLKTLHRDLGHTERVARRSSDALSRLGKGAAIAGVGGLTLGLGAAVKAGFRFNAQMESNELAMRRFVGTGKQTRRFLSDLADLAEKSPFELTQLTQGARRLLAFGVSARQTKDTLTAVADAIAAAGGSAEAIDKVTLALGQMQTKGKVSGEELLQLHEAGIPATKILKRELGLTNDQVAKIGSLGIKSGTAIQALTQGMTKDFKGASAEQARTWDGLTSTLRDKWARTTGSMTRGLFREAKKWVPEITRTLDAIGRIFDGKGTFGEKLRLSSSVVRQNILRPIGQAISQMDLGYKLGQAFERAAPRVVSGFINAFHNAGPWGKLLTLTFLASKLGAFKAAGAMAGARFATSFSATASADVAKSAKAGRFANAGMMLGRAVGIAAAGVIAWEIGKAIEAAANPGNVTAETLGNRSKSQVAKIISEMQGGGQKVWRNPGEGGSGMAGGAVAPRRRPRARPRSRGPRMQDFSWSPPRVRTQGFAGPSASMRAAETNRKVANALERFTEEQRAARRNARQALSDAKRGARARRGGSGDFELNVGNVKIPTAYEVERTQLEGRAANVHNGDVIINVNGGNAKETAQEVAAELARVRATHGAAKARARAGKKRRH